MISGIFQPILGIMAACGMIKGLNTLFVTIGLYPDTCGGYLILNAIGDALFMFLAVISGYTLAEEIRHETNGWISYWRYYVLYSYPKKYTGSIGFTFVSVI